LVDGFTKILPAAKLKKFQYNLNLGRLQARYNLNLGRLQVRGNVRETD
jgi:hypothetical protein